jgi:septum formation inhibitor-activating ATPase MinD
LVCEFFNTAADFDNISKETIEEKIKEINPLYRIKYIDCPAGREDVLVAYVPNI